jgi:hypothetical protein
MSGMPGAKSRCQQIVYRIFLRWVPAEWLQWIRASLTPEAGAEKGRSREPGALAFPTSAKLPPAERAKMDYQNELDRKKAAHQNKYTLLGLALDKGVFALVGVALGSLVLYSLNVSLEARRSQEAKELEEYKLKEARERFFMEKRLEALLAISTAMSDVTRVYFDFTGDKQAAPANMAEEEYRKALEKAREVINRTQILFGADFNADTDRYFEVHREIMRVGVSKCEKYRDFVADLSTRFDLLCQAGLEKKPLPRLPLAPITFAERVRMSPQEYLDKQFERWKTVAGR